MKNNNSLDWKNYSHNWPYSTDAPKNRKWKKDRKELFAKNGNGWWYYHTSYASRYLSDFDKRYIGKRKYNRSDDSSH